MADKPAYKRILLKLSGEALSGKLGGGLDPAEISRLAGEIAALAGQGLEIGLVTGGGNILRGQNAAGIERATADYMGMLATVINALAMQSAIEEAGCRARVLSAIPMQAVCEPYIRRRAIRHMEKGRIVILAGGTGNPFVTTDTAAALRAADLNCAALFKATRVDGVYSADPRTDPGAKRFARLTYQEVIERRLAVMDASAISLCRDNAVPIVVFSLEAKGALARAVQGRGRRTVIGGGA